MRKLLVKLEPERGPKGGFVITTSIDPKLQAAARASLRDGLTAYDKLKGRKSADAFLLAHGEDIGKQSTTDLDALLAEC